MQGHILPITTGALPALATFLARYLSGLPNDIVVSSPLLPGYDVAASFPAPYPRPQILRDVTIKNMKIRPVGTLFVASGIVLGRVVLPAGMNIALDVLYVLPDVLVFDGEVPPAPEPGYLHAADGWGGGRGRRGEAPELPDEPPLPDPVPDRAFAHIRPDAWLPAVSVPAEPEDGTGAVYAISARVVDVPLQVLPGRQKEFSNFVGKVCFCRPLCSVALIKRILRLYLGRRVQLLGCWAQRRLQLPFKASRCPRPAGKLVKFPSGGSPSKAVFT